MVVGLAIAIPFGFIVGVVAGYTRPGNFILNLYLVIGMSAPTVAAIPVIVAIFGLTTPARLATVILFATPVMATNCASGYAQATVDSLVEMGNAFGVGRWRIFTSISTPAALPAILTGTRLGVARAYIGVLAVEFLVLTQGLGRMLVRYADTYQMPAMFVIVLTLVTYGVVQLKFVGWAERSLLAWRKQS